MFNVTAEKTRLDLSEDAARETLRRALKKSVMEIDGSVAFTLLCLTELLENNGAWTGENDQERKERTEAVVRLRGLYQWVKRTDL